VLLDGGVGTVGDWIKTLKVLERLATRALCPRALDFLDSIGGDDRLDKIGNLESRLDLGLQARFRRLHIL
jgi:hypothetical protein